MSRTGRHDHCLLDHGSGQKVSCDKLAFGEPLTPSRRYFRTECEHIVSSRRLSARSEKRLRPISNPIPQQPIVIKRPYSDTNGQTIDHDHTFQITKPTPNPTLVDQILFHQDNSRSEEPAEQHISDARTFSSSPRAISIALPTTSIQQDQTSPLSPTSVLRQRRVLTFNEAMPFPQRSLTIITNLQNDAAVPISQKYQDSGGFPGPLQIANSIFKHAAPSMYRKLQRKMTLPYTTTLDRTLTRSTGSGGITVGRNSDLHTEEMTDEELVEIGGVEYQALRLLSYLIPIVCLCPSALLSIILSCDISSIFSAFSFSHISFMLRGCLLRRNTMPLLKLSLDLFKSRGMNTVAVMREFRLTDHHQVFTVPSHISLYGNRSYTHGHVRIIRSNSQHPANLRF